MNKPDFEKAFPPPRRVMLNGGAHDGVWWPVEEDFHGDLVWTCDEKVRFDLGRYVVRSARSKLARWRLWPAKPARAPETASTRPG